jgi:hypothetical protein
MHFHRNCVVKTSRYGKTFIGRGGSAAFTKVNPEPRSLMGSI